MAAVTAAPSSDSPRRPPPRLAAGALHLFALSGFAVAQPLYDLLGRYPTFFVAHGAAPATIVGFALAFAVLPPLLPIAFTTVARLFGPRAWWAAQLLCVSGLVGLTVLPPLHRAVALPPSLALGVAAVAGGLAARAYAQRHAVRQLCSLLAVTAVIFPLVFLFHSPVASLVRPAAAAAGATQPIARPVPVVMVVFDELALGALLDDAGGIDAGRFPSFAALAAGATWYRNATTVADYTPVAVPALLTGQLPDHNRIPVSAEHPDTLFSLLAPHYRLEVLEPVTQLCAAPSCARPPADSERLRPALLVGDALVIWLHMLAPPAWRTQLPDIGRQWTFRFEHWLKDNLTAPVRGDRAGSFAAFVERIAPQPQPTLWFAHVLLPHYPYEYFPSGVRYNAPPADFHRRPLDLDQRQAMLAWPADNRAGAAAEQQRYLLQLGLVDRLLGRLLERLHATGLYDDALLIVTADHGVSFRPGESQRFLTASNADDILWVPLFIKAPGQRDGLIDDRSVQTIDVLPTVAALLGAAITWRIDGVDRHNPAAPGGTEKVAFTPASLDNQLDLTKLTLSAERPLQAAGWQAQAELFPPGTPVETLLANGPSPHLIGQRVEQLVRRPTPFRAELFDAALYDDVRRPRGAVPAFVRGRLMPSDAIDAPPPLAIAVNGVIAATTDSFIGSDGRVQFGALLPESAFRAGANRVEVFGIAIGGQILLRLDQ
ncbi:MAG: sulfatase-like hydrolase/transferase [Deltaproteobacteria bacterium]|nr:sulfatase-like hydrolase/transferase [Deltaproteobacteria bacterium]